MIVFGSPSRYIQGPGALSWLGRELVTFGESAALVIDPLVQDTYGAEIADHCAKAGIALTQLRFGGECTDAEVARLAEQANGFGVIVAAGGGKCIDAGKALSHRTGAWMISIPTVASNDAPTSHIYVMYDADHRLLEVRKLPRNPALVIVDTAVIARAPRSLFAAGIGDAIGKIYEVEACAQADGLNVFAGRSAQSALALARTCHAILLDHAEAALAAIERQQPDAALELVVEATVLMSGLAFESGGLSISHSMTRGLSQVPKYAATLHGLQIAYANLVQLRLEGRDLTEIRFLCDFYARCGLPRSLSELGGRPEANDIARIAADTMTSPHITHFARPLSAEEIADAMNWVETRDMVESS
jgi:glycerol dehydrogenase